MRGLIHVRHDTDGIVRRHQGLDGAIIEPDNDNAGQGRVVRRQRLGRLLSSCYREVA